MKRAVLALAVVFAAVGFVSSLRTLAVEATVPHALQFDDLRLFSVTQASDSSSFIDPDTIGAWISDRNFVYQRYASCTAKKQNAIAQKDLVALKRYWRECIEILRDAVQQRPADGRLWLELAKAKVGLEGLSTEAVEALRMSYVTALREGWIAKPRQTFAKGIWVSLPHEVRTFALEEDLDSVQLLAMGSVLLPDRSSQGNQRALAKLEASAGKDNAYALEKLGEIYLKGDGVPADVEKARAYLERAVEKGSTGAQLRLGQALWKGDRFPKDQVRGLQLIESAALTSEWAQEVLGSMLLSGELPRDVPRAITLLESSANSGNTYALEKLGETYLRGDGVPADTTKAGSYLEKAIEKGSTTAQVELGQALWSGNQLPRDRVKGLRLIESAARTDAWGQQVLGSMLWSGELPRDASRALQLLEASAKQGNPYALEKLGVIYLRGDGVEADLVKAKAYLEQAVEKGSIGAHVALGEALWKGDQLPQDRTKALRLLETAALTNSWGQLVLGRILLENRHDVPRALALLERSADSGNRVALETLAKIYETGNGVPSDPVKGKMYLTRARALVQD